MDFFSALTLCIILFIVFSLCGFCCRSKRKGTIFSSVLVSLLLRTLVVIIFLIILVNTCTRWCRKDPTRTIYPTPVVVTSATHTAPGGYPTGMQTVSVYPATCSASGYQQPVYPQQAPYPVSGGPSGMPMPMPSSQMQPNPIGMHQQVMPPYPTAGPGINPPSYESAVGPNPNIHPNPNQTGYEKQSPYNPSYPTGY